MPGTLDAWANLATVAGVGVAFISAGLVVWQVRKAREAAHEERAKAAHQAYIHLCIEHPELSSSEAFLVYLKAKRATMAPGAPTTQSAPGAPGTSATGAAAPLDYGNLDYSGRDAEVERYAWFVSFMLNTMEQIHETQSGDAAWNAVIASIVGHHGPYLAKRWADSRPHYGDDFTTLVDASI